MGLYFPGHINKPESCRFCDIQREIQVNDKEIHICSMSGKRIIDLDATPEQHKCCIEIDPQHGRIVDLDYILLHFSRTHIHKHIYSLAEVISLFLKYAIVLIESGDEDT